MPDEPKLGPWRLALIRMFQPNPDLAAETCEWVIAIAVGIALSMSGYFLGRIVG